MQDRDTQFAALLRSDRLDSYALKHACLPGIPDGSGLRSEAWRCLLGVVDLSEPGLHAREASKSKRREQYYQLAQELIQDSSKPNPEARKSTQDTWLDDIDKDVRRTQTSYAFFAQRTSFESPLVNPRVLFDRLDRLHPHRRQEIEERYSLGPHPSSSSSSSPKGKGRESDGGEEPSSATVDGRDRHFECLIRLLYVFALLNPAVNYVQGMSELVAPLYYVFSQPVTTTNQQASSSSSSSSTPLFSSPEQHQYAEADAFWAFTTLMAEIGDFYVQDSDGTMQEQEQHHRLTGVSNPGEAGSMTGLGAALRRFSKELHWLDTELAYSLHRKKEIQPTFYALRWITCLFAMEFRIPYLIRIWDSLFALLAENSSMRRTPVKKGLSRSTGGGGQRENESQARDFLLDICCAMVLVKRGQLLSGTFASCLGVLQNYVCDDVDALLSLAFSIREKRITASLTGLDFSDYSSMPNSPAVPDSEDGRFPTSPSRSSQLVSPASIASAKNMLAGVAGSSTAKALRQRFWKQQDSDFPDDASDISAATAPAAMEGRGAFSPTRLVSNSSTSNTSPAATATSFPSSASTLFNKYASSFSQSDAAAALSKATTNSYITALQWRESAPSTISKIRSDVEARVTGAAGAAKTIVRPPSPHMDPPFTPPTANTGRWLSPEGGGSPAGILGERRGSGPKPLLLSSSARRASTQLHDGLAMGTNGHVPAGSPISLSRRVSYTGQGGSLGLGLPPSASLDSPSISRAAARTPSPTASFRPLPSAAPHARAASASIGTYKIGSGRNGGTNGQVEHLRASSMSASAPSPPLSQFVVPPTTQARSLDGIPESSQAARVTKDNDDDEDDIPLGQLKLASNGLPSPAAHEQKRRQRAEEINPFSVLRDKAASNDLEVLDDEVVDSIVEQELPALNEILTFQPSTAHETATEVVSPIHDSFAAVSAAFPIPPVRNSSWVALPTPPLSPVKTERYSLTDVVPPPSSPTSSNGIMSRIRRPRTSSLAKDIPTSTLAQERPSPARQPSASEDMTAGMSTGQKLRRKLASSRRISRGESVRSSGTGMGGEGEGYSARSSMDL